MKSPAALLLKLIAATIEFSRAHNDKSVVCPGESSADGKSEDLDRISSFNIKEIVTEEEKNS